MTIKVEQSKDNVQVVVLGVPQPEPPARPDPEIPPITIDPEQLGGTPAIAGNRVPVTALIDRLREGKTVTEFAEEYGVSTGDVDAVLALIRGALEDGWLAERVN